MNHIFIKGYFLFEKTHKVIKCLFTLLGILVIANNFQLFMLWFDFMACNRIRLATNPQPRNQFAKLAILITFFTVAKMLPYRNWHPN